MLKRHVLSFHNEVTSFRGRSIISKNSISKSQSQQQISSTKSSNKAGYKRTMECPNLLKYNSNVTLSPGTLMTVFKCPVEGCNKKSCTDIKSFKLHCMHIHQVNMLPLYTMSDKKNDIYQQFQIHKYSTYRCAIFFGVRRNTNLPFFFIIMLSSYLHCMNMLDYVFCCAIWSKLIFMVLKF